MAEQRVIQEGDCVLFKRDEHSKVFQIFRKRQIFFEKTKIRGDQLVGQAYGTKFEVQHGKLVAAVPLPEKSLTSADNTGCGSVAGKDNRNLVASEENQKLSQEEIMKMKGEGLSGQEIVGKLVEQSETFKTKTEHMVEFRVLQPNASLLLDVYKQTPFKICNVMSGATVAVVESCQGLVLGAVMERMGGSGRVLHLYPGNDMNRHNVKNFNFTAEHMAVLHEFPLNKLASLENGTLLSSTSTGAVESDRGTGSSDAVSRTDEGNSKAATAADSDNVKSDEVQMGDSPEKNIQGDSAQADREAKKQERTEKLKAAANILLEKNLDSLLIATKHDPVPLLLRLLPYVAPSRCVVIFCQHKEPLVECYTQVREKGLGVQLRLSESWYREYQVLPSRTHPLMSMSGTGGYLLSFIRVTS
ncbi:hypothetical protein BaRGS_00020132 [Batillaria attramentaria]|uniref:tRNA (adenine(58)-N(1))-methyltransferase non-catalytic subunit TRM6 n=1 Tax=Batillaria attramentaria TaxID=370345 RepID=A0ABD0KNP9_9CAEN